MEDKRMMSEKKEDRTQVVKERGHETHTRKWKRKRTHKWEKETADATLFLLLLLEGALNEFSRPL